MFRKNSLILVIILALGIQSFYPIQNSSAKSLSSLPNGQFVGWIIMKASSTYDDTTEGMDVKQLETMDIQMGTGTMTLTSTNTGMAIRINMQMPFKYYQWSEVIDEGTGVCRGYRFDTTGHGKLKLIDKKPAIYYGNSFTSYPAIFTISSFGMNIRKIGNDCLDVDIGHTRRVMESEIQSIFAKPIEFTVNNSSSDWSGNCFSPAWSEQPNHTFHCLWYLHKVSKKK